MLEKISLGLKNLFGPGKKTVNKLVSKIPETLPGKSTEELNTFRKQIAKFAKENNLQRVDIFDPRVDMPEDVSPSIENKLMNIIGIKLTSVKGKVVEGQYNYFESSKNFYKNFFKSLSILTENVNK